MMDVMRVNFFGVVNVTNAVLPHMRNRREGLIVFIGSRSVFRSQVIVSQRARLVCRIHISILMTLGHRFVICFYLWVPLID